MKFIKLTKLADGIKVLINVNDIIFINDVVSYREVQVKLIDSVIILEVVEEINTIYDMIEVSQQPICD